MNVPDYVASALARDEPLYYFRWNARGEPVVNKITSIAYISHTPYITYLKWKDDRGMDVMIDIAEVYASPAAAVGGEITRMLELIVALKDELHKLYKLKKGFANK